MFREGLGLAAAFFVAALVTPAFAQSNPSAPADPAASQSAAEPAPEDQPAVLDEITVTAQKREENIQQVPVSVTAMSADELEVLSAGGADVKFLSGRVPSLQLESSFGRAFPRFYIRGLGNTDFDLNASQPVSMIVDDVVLENPVVKGMPLFDVDHVEVLRGPQGTLFGRNTPAGVVKFDTRKPTEDFDGSVRLSYGTFGQTNLEAAVGGGLTPTLSARASVLHQSEDDWVDNAHTGKKNALGGYSTTAWRGQLLWKPSEDFNALVNLHGWDVDGTARIFRANILKPGTNDLVDGYRQDVVFQDGKNQQNITSHGAALKLNYELGGATLTSVSGYETLHMLSRGDIDGGFGCGFCGLANGPGFIPFASESADGIPDLDQITEELRIASHSGGSWDWLAGLYYFKEKLKAETHSYDSLSAGNPQDGFATQQQDAKSWALFGSVDFRPSEKWTLKGGLRYTDDKKDFSAERPDGTFQPPTSGPIKKHTDASLVTGDLSATYRVNDNVNVYGRVGTGFRAPSIQGRILFCADFEGGTNPETNCVSVAKEEKLRSAEVGIKSELLDRKLRVNLSLYDYQVSDQQLVAVGGLTNTARLLNADKTKGYGFEANVDIAPSSAWLITLGGSYNHTEIDDPSLLVGPCFSCTITDPIVGGNVRIDGNPLPNAPELIFNGIVDYRRPIGQGLFSWSFDWAYASKKNFFLYESKEFNADSMELGTRIGYTFPGARYELAIFGRNLTDEKIVQGGIDFDNLTGMTNEPRAIGLEFAFRF
jgi:iron complex outermembrane receptor protein